MKKNLIGRKRKLKELMKNENDQLVKREMKTIEHDFNRKG